MGADRSGSGRLTGANAISAEVCSHPDHHFLTALHFNNTAIMPPAYPYPTLETITSVLFVAGIGILMTIRLGRYLRPSSLVSISFCVGASYPPLLIPYFIEQSGFSSLIQRRQRKRRRAARKASSAPRVALAPPPPPERKCTSRAIREVGRNCVTCAPSSCASWSGSTRRWRHRFPHALNPRDDIECQEVPNDKEPTAVPRRAMAKGARASRLDTTRSELDECSIGTTNCSMQVSTEICDTNLQGMPPRQSTGVP